MLSSARITEYVVYNDGDDSSQYEEGFGKRLFRLGVRKEHIKSGKFRRFGVGVVIPSILDSSLQLVYS